MGIVIGVVNQKGGVGKTTTATNITAGLGALGKKVLLIDFDPQGNSTSGFGIKKKMLENTTYDVIIGNCRPSEAIIPTRYKNISIMPANAKLSEAEPLLMNMEQKSMQLRKAILQIRDDYDIIIIDSLPSLGILAVNTLAACDTIIVPMVCEQFAVEGLAQLMVTIKNVKKFNRDLSIMGVVYTMVDKRLLSVGEIKEIIGKAFDNKAIFKTEIPRNVRISEAQAHGEPIMYFDKRSKGAEAFTQLSKEVLVKCREMEKANAKKK